jgi:type II secretory pathway predicted ATPase ExeA
MPAPTTLPPKGLHELLDPRERVFPTHPQVARYFPATAIEDARQRLSRTIERGDGPGLVVGGVGTGKSLLLQVLAAQFQDRFDIVLLACARICTRRALLQAILFELGLPYRLRDEGELRLSLLDHLLSINKCPEGLLILVDEAQVLPPALLDELRVMTNLVRGGAPRVRLVLAGSAALEEVFASPELESFSQRLSARCYLAAFNRDETTQFIQAQLAASGGEADELFTLDACTAVFNATDGVPRLINQLCDRAMLLANSKQLDHVDSDLIQSAWADLQQLPAPWDSLSTTICPSAPADIIEFGGLSANDSTVSMVAVAGESSAEIESMEPDFDVAADEYTAPPREYAKPPEAPKMEPPQVTDADARTDPFGEKFAEEEIVIDSFAAWDDMFRRETPRVENHRNPEFAGLVQAAMHDSVRASQITIRCNRGAPDDSHLRLDVREHDELFAFDDHPPGKTPEDLLVEEDDLEPAHEEFSSLRLSVLSDPFGPSHLAGPESRATSMALNPQSVRRVGFEDDSDDWPEVGRLTPVGAVFSGSELSTATKGVASAEDPILVVEEDVPPPSLGESPIRQEDYRNLFSRLRSG